MPLTRAFVGAGNRQAAARKFAHVRSFSWRGYTPGQDPHRRKSPRALLREQLADGGLSFSRSGLGPGRPVSRRRSCPRSTRVTACRRAPTCVGSPTCSSRPRRDTARSCSARTPRDADSAPRRVRRRQPRDEMRLCACGCPDPTRRRAGGRRCRLSSPRYDRSARARRSGRAGGRRVSLRTGSAWRQSSRRSAFRNVAAS